MKRKRKRHPSCWLKRRTNGVRISSRNHKFNLSKQIMISTRNNSHISRYNILIKPIISHSLSHSSTVFKRKKKSLWRPYLFLKPNNLKPFCQGRLAMRAKLVSLKWQRTQSCNRLLCWVSFKTITNSQVGLKTSPAPVSCLAFKVCRVKVARALSFKIFRIALC